MVLLKQNHKLIYETAEFLKSIGVRSFSATKASPSLNSRNFNEFRLSIEELRSSLDDLEAVKEKLEMNVDVLECYPLCLLSNLNKFWHYGRRNCTAGITTCTVGSDGNIRPCSHSDMCYGNIFEEELIDIFSKMDDWRNGKYIPDSCKQCDYLRMCSGGCRMEAKYLGDICGKDSYMTTPDDIVPRFADASKINEISLNQKYSLKAGFRWRKEEFGAVISAPGSDPLLINEDGLNVVKKMSNSSFSIKEMAKENNSKPELIKTFFLRLLQCRLIFPVSIRR
jgi:radical SAM protein with 4Fe4S-binding SPASM domain